MDEKTIDWNAIKTEYIAGGTSYRKLAKKYGVPFGTLKRVAAREDWVGLRERADADTTTKIIDAISTGNAERAAKIIAVADKILDKISEMIDRASTIDSQSIKHYTSALKDLKEIKGIKSDADMREQEARIANLRRAIDKENEDVKEITVTFEAGEDAWNE